MITTTIVWVLVATGNVRGSIATLSQHASLASCLNAKTAISRQINKTPNMVGVVLECHRVT